MAKRTPVSGLDISGISTKPMARPVETYVRPAEIQTQLSPLSEFVNAITPAVKAVEDKKLEERLKREREVENFRLKSKYAQMETNAYELDLSVGNDFKLNEKTYVKDYTSSSYLDKIKKHQDNYLSNLRNQGTDELVIEAAQLKFNEYNVKRVADFNASKATYNTNLLNTNNMDTHTQTMLSTEQTKEQKIENHKAIIDKFAEANPLPNGKPDFKRAIDNAYTLLKSQDTFDNTLWDALSTIKSKDGKKLPVMYTAEKRKETAVMEKARAKQMKEAYAVKVKSIGMNRDFKQALENGTKLSLTYYNEKNEVETFTPLEMQEHLKTNSDWNSLNLNQKFKFMATSGVVFPEIKREVEGISKFFNSDQEQTSSNDAKINGIYKKYWSMRNNGIPPEKISTEKYFHKRMEVMKFLVETEAGTGNFVRTNPIDIDGDDIGDPEVGVETVITPNFNAAASQIRKMDLDTPVYPELKTKIDDALTKGFNSKLVGSANLPKIKGEIAEAVHIISMSGVGSFEEHLEKAIEIVEKDYQIVTSSTGEKYAYKALNTDIDIGVNAGEIIPKYNELAAKSKEVKQWLKDFVPDLYDTNDYDLRFEPDEKNPNKIQLNVYDGTGRFKGQIGEKSATKRDLLGSQEQFNLFMATIKTQDRPVLTTTYTTPSDIVIGSALDSALYPEAKEKPEANDFSNILSMINPESTGQFEKTVALGKEGQVTPPSKGILKDIGDGIESTIKYVLNSFGDPMVQNSEAIGALSTKLGKVLTDPIIKLISDEIEKTKNFEGFNTLNNQDVQDDKQSSLLDLINPISTATASVLDETQVGEFIPSNQPTGEQVTIEGNTIIDKTSNMIAKQEGFSPKPYKDGKDRSVAYGFYLPALEPDERALIKDIDNVTKEEGAAVLRLKVQKISNYLDQQIQGFRNIPEKAQSAIISMGYQLGVTNIPKTWKKFTAHIKEAAQYAEGSVEQAQALAKAKFEMLYNVAEDGTISLNKWATQTKKRAFEMAEAVGEETKEFANEVSSGIMDYIFPKAEAATLTKGDTFKINEKPSTDTIVSIAKDKNPAEMAVKLLGVSEGSSVGREAIYGMWENIVGDVKQKGQSLENFVANNSWCALFVTQVLRDSGVDTSKFIKTKDKYDFARIKTYQTAGKPVYNGLAPEGQPRGSFANAQAGDVLVKQHSPEESKRIGSKGHAGIVVKVEGSKVYFIAGNQSDQVQLSSYDMNELSNAITIRRFTADDNVPSKELPSFLDMKTQANTTKFKNFMTSAYNWVTNK